MDTASHRRYRRAADYLAASRFHVEGYIEERTTTTPYELADTYAREREEIRRQIRRDGVDPEWITNWSWT